MHKYFCDICKEEIKETPCFFRGTMSEGSFDTVQDYSIDLCEKCKKKLKKKLIDLLPANHND